LLTISNGHISMVTATGLTAAIGSTLELDVKIAGVDITAMVDTGSQSSRHHLQGCLAQDRWAP